MFLVGDKMSKVRELCIEHTDLSLKDIEQLEHIEKHLQFMANNMRADIFIDCPTRESDQAVIVAEAKPTTVKSSYKTILPGQMAYRKNEPAALRTMSLGVITQGLKALTQESMIVTQTVDPIINDIGKVIGVLIVEKAVNDGELLKSVKDIGDSRKKPIEFGYEEENSITYHISDGIIILDDDGIVRFRNPVAEEMYRNLGYRDSIIGLDFSNISLENMDYEDILNSSEKRISEVSIGRFSFRIEYNIKRSIKFRVIMIVKDITNIKEKEKELVLKAVVIKEIHHRVKNNLQTIASLLRLQARRSDSDEIKNILAESISRILSIASTHEILAQEGIDKVKIQEILHRIRNSVSSCYSISKKNITINMGGDDFEIESGKGTDVALIVSELLSNSLKHGFKNKESGNIDIEIKNNKGFSTISIEDNGVGFDIEDVEEKSLGISIVKSLVTEKLQGSLKIKSDINGTRVVFSFKN